MRRPERRGVILIEMLVALAVTGIVLASVSQTLIAVDVAARAAIDESHRADKAANGPRTLRELASQLEPSSDSSRQFSGNEAHAVFQTWCRVPGGWSERCLVELSIGSDEGRVALFATTTPGLTLPLVSGARSVELRYLDVSGGDGQRWLRAWGAGILAPFALGVIIDGDTAVIRIGERG